MKSFYRITLVVFLVLLLGCGQQQQTFTEAEKETIQKEVKAQFNQLVSAVNQLNAGCLLYTSPSPRDGLLSRMPSSA